MPQMKKTGRFVGETGLHVLQPSLCQIDMKLRPIILIVQPDRVDDCRLICTPTHTNSAVVWRGSEGFLDSRLGVGSPRS